MKTNNLKQEFTFNETSITFYASDQNPIRIWVNASEMAQIGIISPSAWLKLESTSEFIEEIILSEKCKYSDLVKTDKNNNNIWFRQDLACFRYAREYSATFENWCTSRMIDISCDLTIKIADKKIQGLKSRVETLITLLHKGLTSNDKTEYPEGSSNQFQESLNALIPLDIKTADDETLIEELKKRGYDLELNK